MSTHEEDMDKLEEKRKKEAKLDKLQAVAQQNFTAQSCSKEGAKEDQDVREVDRLFQPYSQVTSIECDICREEFSASSSTGITSTTEDNERGASADDIDTPSDPSLGGTGWREREREGERERKREREREREREKERERERERERRERERERERREREREREREGVGKEGGREGERKGRREGWMDGWKNGG